MKILITGKNSQEIEEIVKKTGFEMVTDNPDVVISYGGDGTLLYSERLYPGVPKLPIRNSLVCKRCPDHDEKFLLNQLTSGKLNLKEYRKLHTNINGRDLLALNDFVLRNEHPIHAIRFKIPSINNKLFIGDGIVISTSFGSTGYFKSITGQIFEDGFGLAFNNITEKTPPSYFHQDKITFQLIRGRAILTYDNSEEIFYIEEGKTLSFEPSTQVARIYEAQSLRCPKCKVTR